MKLDVFKPLTARQRAEIARLEAMPEEDIDTSDIPEIVDWSDVVRGPIRNPRAVREAIMAKRAARAAAALPSSDGLLVPTIVALRHLGGSANVKELTDRIAGDLSLPDDVLSYRRETATMNEVPYRAAWARTYLKRRGYVQSTARGVWTLTQDGRDASPAEIARIPSDLRKMKASSPEENLREEAETEVASEETWKTRLLESVGSMSPAAFERLAQRLLRESGFIKVEVTGRSGDQGIAASGCSAFSY